MYVKENAIVYFFTPVCNKILHILHIYYENARAFYYGFTILITFFYTLISFMYLYRYNASFLSLLTIITIVRLIFVDY